MVFIFFVFLLADANDSSSWVGGESVLLQQSNKILQSSISAHSLAAPLT